MLSILRALLPLLACSVHASVTSAPAVQTTPRAANLNATCPSRTVNYITHGLPQQCLTSSWRSTSTSLTANSTDDTGPDGVHTPILASNATLVSAEGAESPTVASQDSISTLSEGLRDATSTEPASPKTSASALASPSAEADEPSPLEDEKFMSFEEWKKQNLQKVGQSEHVGRDAQVERQVPRKRPMNIQTALDALGDDAEIDLDFSGFIPDGPDIHAPDHRSDNDKQGQDIVDPDTPTAPSIGHRSKDAGTTCKERYNYASFDCAASVRKYNAEAGGATTVLGENKDSYMLNVCSVDNKFLIIELCNDISIDTIVLANFEFFSSTFRTFRVSVSDKYPVKIDKWKTLGTFEARNTREVQAFLVENPVIWARYLRIEFLTHYGSEYYCPVSLVRVHGTTMMEEYKHDMESLQAEDEDAVEETPALEAAGEKLVPEAVADVILDEREREAQGASQEAAPLPSTPTDAESESSVVSDSVSNGESESPKGCALSLEEAKAMTETSPSTSLHLANMVPHDTCLATETASEERVTNSEAAHPSPPTVNPIAQTAESKSSNTESESGTKQVGHGYKTATSATSENFTSSSAPTESPQKSQNTTEASQINPNTTSLDRPKASSSTTQPHAAVPTMQESFFKSVQKRLQMLEANSSLSLQYIEDQSRALRDAFNRVEQRQLAKTTTFLDYLNTTVLSELRDFRQQYDLLWQSTVIELETQRERYQQETSAINARLGILADELIFQKRVAVLQTMMILVCLGLVLFSRGNLNQYLEMPVVQRVLSRSPSSRWLNVASVDTPTQSPPPTRVGSVYKRHGILKGHRRMASEDSIEDSLSPQEMYSPPTPISVGDVSDGDLVKDVSRKLEDPEFDPSSIERPSTSPPMLPSSATPSTPELNGVAGHETIESRLDSSLDTDEGVPRVVVEEATPPTKHLTWSLPNS